MNLYWGEIKIIHTFVVIVKIILVATVIFLLSSFFISYVLEKSEGKASFKVFQRNRVGKCIDTVETQDKFKLFQAYFDKVVPYCPCCIDKNKPCAKEPCITCQKYYRLLKEEKCDAIDDNDIATITSVVNTA